MNEGGRSKSWPLDHTIVVAKQQSVAVVSVVDSTVVTE